MVIDILDEEKMRRKYPGYPCQEKCTDPSGRCKCRSGDGHFCNQQAGSESESSGSFPDLNGASECTGRCLF